MRLATSLISQSDVYLLVRKYTFLMGAIHIRCTLVICLFADMIGTCLCPCQLT